MIIILGYLIVETADRARFVDAHRDLVERARAFPGCVHLAISEDGLDPCRVNNAEVWESPEALAAWRAVANAPGTGIEILSDRVRRFDATDGGAVF